MLPDNRAGSIDATRPCGVVSANLSVTFGIVFVTFGIVFGGPVVDIRIRKNEFCVVGLPSCDYVFSSTRSCFIAYGFATSGLERDVLIPLLEERGIEPVEAGEQIDPAKYVFCTKICSKIIMAQFCIVMVNHDKRGDFIVPNANVNMEYGLMLGHNKYVIPFQRDDMNLPFNVSGLDTIKYNQSNFRRLAIQAIDLAIKQTAQKEPVQDSGRIITNFGLMNETVFVNPHHSAGDKDIFEIGKNFGFNLLISFDGLSYIYLRNFANLPAAGVIWRLSKLADFWKARLSSVPFRLSIGQITAQGHELIKAITEKLQIWLIVSSATEKDEVNTWIAGVGIPFPLKLYTWAEVEEFASTLP
ncbi:MAG: nucleotide-binding protein [Acetobacteraceae bacterium]|nr:nucleotide-binding protein [Acetobacteraceae bacterium]